MKDIVKVLAVAVTSLAFNGVSLAQAKPTPATPAAPAMEMKPEKAKDTVLTGKVTSVDSKAGQLTLKLKEKEVKLTTESKSTKSALEKLKVGDIAKVFEKGGKVIAASPVKAESQTKAAK